MSKASVKAVIDAAIRQNGNQEITATVLNSVLNQMVDEVPDVVNDVTTGGTGKALSAEMGKDLGTEVSQLAQEVGDLADLQTTDKSSIVAAINEAAQTGGGGSNLTGYVSVASIADLPDPGEDTLGYLIGENLYLYVGTGGDTLDGKYQDCGPFRGPAGQNGTPGTTGQDGKSTYQIWLEAGNVGTEDDFLASLQGNSGYTGAAGELEVVNNLIDGGATKALSAQMGVILKGLINTIPEHALITEDGIIFCDSYLNIGAKLNSEGFTAINSLEIIEL